MGGAHLCKASSGTDSNYCQDLKGNALVEWPAKERGGGGGKGVRPKKVEHMGGNIPPLFLYQ